WCCDTNLLSTPDGFQMALRQETGPLQIAKALRVRLPRATEQPDTVQAFIGQIMRKQASALYPSAMLKQELHKELNVQSNTFKVVLE
ncbi:hypothetical protein HispidOSU_006517, partial [Sigmodon hispidus]